MILGLMFCGPTLNWLALKGIIILSCKITQFPRIFENTQTKLYDKIRKIFMKSKSQKISSP